MSTTVVTPAEQKPAFDPLAYNRERNEREAAARTGKEPAKPAAQAEPVVHQPAADLDDEEKAHAGLPRSARREINKLRNEAGELRGELKALRELYEKQGMKPAEATAAAVQTIAEDADAEPDRAKFATTEEYSKAVATWAAKQESKKAEATRQWVDHVMAMTAKAADDIAIIPDYEAHAKEADAVLDEQGNVVEAGVNYVPWAISEHRQFHAWLLANEHRALAMDYFATRPDELKEVLALSAKPSEQARELLQLDGFLKREYRKLQKAAETKPKGEEGGEEAGKTAKAAVKVAPKLPPPSEAAAVRGGSAPVVGIKPMLDDGKTVNPAWLAQRNERERR